MSSRKPSASGRTASTASACSPCPDGRGPALLRQLLWDLRPPECRPDRNAAVADSRPNGDEPRKTTWMQARESFQWQDSVPDSARLGRSCDGTSRVPAGKAIDSFPTWHPLWQPVPEAQGDLPP